MSNSTLVKCDAAEAFHLFQVLADNGITGGFEYNRGRLSDPFIAVSSSPVDVEYVEREGGDDSIVLKLGTMEIGFDISTSHFAKEIYSRGMLVSIYDDQDDASLWFSSSDIPEEVMKKAKDYTPPKDGLYMHDLPEGGCMVMFQGGTSIFSAEEVEEIKQESLLAEHKRRMENQL